MGLAPRRDDEGQAGPVVDGTPIDREKLLSLHVGKRTKPRVREGRDDTGRWKSTTDELNNTVTERADRQDVTIRAPEVGVSTRVDERRN